MDRSKARLISEKVYDLIMLCAEYEASFHSRPPSHDSPEEAWQLSGRIHDKQCEIAGMLDQDSLSATNVSTTGWTLFSQYMNLTLATHMMRAVSNLIIYCIQAEKELDSDFRQMMVRNQQYIISRMLDPKSIRERSM